MIWSSEKSWGFFTDCCCIIIKRNKTQNICKKLTAGLMLYLHVLKTSSSQDSCFNTSKQNLLQPQQCWPTKLLVFVCVPWISAFNTFYLHVSSCSIRFKQRFQFRNIAFSLKPHKLTISNLSWKICWGVERKAEGESRATKGAAAPALVEQRSSGQQAPQPASQRCLSDSHWPCWVKWRDSWCRELWTHTGTKTGLRYARNCWHAGSWYT